MKKNARKTVTNNTAVVAKRYHHEYKLRNIFDRLVLCDNPKYIKDYAVWLIDEGQGYMDEEEYLEKILETKNLIQPTLSNETTNILLKAITDAIPDIKGDGKIKGIFYQEFMKKVASNIAVGLNSLDNDKVKFIAATQAKIQNIWTELDSDSAMLLSIGLLCAKVSKGISKNKVNPAEDHSEPKKTEKNSKPGLNLVFDERVENFIDRAGVRRHPRPDYLNEEVERVEVDEVIPAENPETKTENQSKVEAKIIEEMNHAYDENETKNVLDIAADILIEEFSQMANHGGSVALQLFAMGTVLGCKISDKQHDCMQKLPNDKTIELIQRVIRPVLEVSFTKDELNNMMEHPENISITGVQLGVKFIKNLVDRILKEIDKDTTSDSDTDDTVEMATTTEIVSYKGKRTKLCELNRDEVEAYYYIVIEEENLTREGKYKLDEDDIRKNVAACMCFHKFDKDGNQIKCFAAHADKDCSKMNLSTIRKAS